MRDTFVLPVHDVDTGIRVDFIFSTTPYERQAIERAVIVELGGEPVPFASAEDLVIVRLGSRTRAHARASQTASSGTRGNRLTPPHLRLHIVRQTGFDTQARASD